MFMSGQFNNDLVFKRKHGIVCSDFFLHFDFFGGSNIVI